MRNKLRPAKYIILLYCTVQQAVNEKQNLPSSTGRPFVADGPAPTFEWERERLAADNALPATKYEVGETLLI